MIKEEKVKYICLSKKDKIELRLWNKGLYTNNPVIKKKKKQTDRLSIMADLLKGKSYNYFLNSTYWNIVRKRVLERDKYKCVICHSVKNLQVHHDTYKHHFREHLHLSDLMVLCKSCHKEHHYAQP